jgi:hypothetical protein
MRIRRKIGLPVIVLLVAGIGCSDKNDVPSGILSKEVMQNVLWDMIQSDQYSTYLAKDSAHVDLKMENLRLYDQVFRLHHVSREEFSKSYKYYLAHPEMAQTLFDSLLAMGNRLRAENYNRPYTRSVPAAPVTPPAVPSTPPATTPNGSKRADSLQRKPTLLPVPPMRAPLRHPSSTSGQKPAKP